MKSGNHRAHSGSSVTNIKFKDFFFLIKYNTFEQGVHHSTVCHWGVPYLFDLFLKTLYLFKNRRKLNIVSLVSHIVLIHVVSIIEMYLSKVKSSLLSFYSFSLALYFKLNLFKIFYFIPNFNIPIYCYLFVSKTIFVYKCQIINLYLTLLRWSAGMKWWKKQIFLNHYQIKPFIK